MVKGKDIVFIFEEQGSKEFIDSIKSDNKLFICRNDEIKKKLEKENFTCRTIQEITTVTDKEITKAIRWIKSWPDLKMYENKNFKEMLVYDGISIYWFLESRLFFYRIKELLILIEQIKQIFSNERPQKIWIKGDNDLIHIVTQLNKEGLQECQKLEKGEKERAINYKSYRGYPTLKLSLLKLLRGTSIRKSRLSSENKFLITEGR